MSLELGALAPDFTLPTDGNASITLSALRGNPVVLYFYPKDDTSGCTAQACQFRDLHPDFAELDAVILGISKDSATSHDRFKKKYDLPFSLVSDSEGLACAAYGVWVEKSMYGKRYMGIERTTYLIDRDGKIAKIWHKVKVPDHGAEVLQALKAL